MAYSIVGSQSGGSYRSSGRGLIVDIECSEMMFILFLVSAEISTTVDSNIVSYG